MTMRAKLLVWGVFCLLVFAGVAYAGSAFGPYRVREFRTNRSNTHRNIDPYFGWPRYGTEGVGYSVLRAADVVARAITAAGEKQAKAEIEAARIIAAAITASSPKGKDEAASSD